MLSFLKNHPFAVEAFFESSLVLTYAIPKEELEPFIPECLELDTFLDKWAFITAAIVKTKDLRPRGFPKFLSNGFILTGSAVVGVPADILPTISICDKKASSYFNTCPIIIQNF